MDPNQMSDEEFLEYIRNPNLSEAELRQMILSPAVQAAQRVETERRAQEPSPLTEWMGGWELYRRGLEQSLLDPLVHGPEDLARAVWSGPPEQMKEYNRQKAERQEMERAVGETTAGKMGYFTGKAGMSMALPVRLGSQIVGAALGGFMSPTQKPISGAGSELATRAMQAAEAGGTTAIVGLPMSAIGRALGASTGRFTPEGAKAMELDEAAKRIGVKRDIASLDPSGTLAGFERSLPGYPRTVERQIQEFTEAAKKDVAIPSKSGRSTETRTLEGEKIREAIEEAGKNLQQVGSSMWNDLDAYIVQNNLPGVKTGLATARVQDIASKYTPRVRGQADLNRNPIFQRVEEYDPDAASLLKQFLQDPKKPQVIPFSDLHKVQTAVGKAMSRAERDAGAPGASMADRQARTELKNLYGSLMNDVDAWGTKNPQAQEMFDSARGFWRDVVVPGVITSKPYGKASKGTYGRNPRGYSEPSQLYRDVLSNPRAIQDLYPYMSQTGKDLVDTLRSMEDVGRALAGRVEHPHASGMGSQTVAAGTLIGSPLQMSKALVSHFPGVHQTLNSPMGKRAYFARNVLRDTPLGRVSWGMLQEPQGRAEDYMEDLRKSGIK